jgi:hypothetical protein
VRNTRELRRLITTSVRELGLEAHLESRDNDTFDRRGDAPVVWDDRGEPRPVPTWANTGPAFLRHVTSARGDAIGFLFADPLTAPPGHSEHSNKVLWVMRLPRLGSPLVLEGRQAGRRNVVRIERSADSGPGEIYPSIVDVPTPGCWHFTLSWAGHRDEIDLRYSAA